MLVGLYRLISPVHDEKIVKESSKGFLKNIEEIIKDEFVESSIGETNNYPLTLIFVESGGVEGLFKENYRNLKEPYYLLTTGENNSFAASLEILTFLGQQGLKGEILHGSIEYIANRIKNINKVLKAKEKLNNMNVGVIGKPSDWLISSDVDYVKLKERFGMNAVDISIDELLDEIDEVKIEDIEKNISNKRIEELYKKSLNNKNLEDALKIYLALKNICKKYELKGLTIRCFDLLSKVHNTGCIAVSLLNDEGIISSCEGDLPALISMLILNVLTGEPIFMANPSSIDTDKNQIVLAHCTIPLNMTEDYVLDTHFESKIGVGIHGEIKIGDATIFKLNANLEECFASRINILENMYHKNLCRTQIKVDMDKAVDYFLKNPMGNHHLVCRGDYSELLKEFMEMI